MRNFKIKTMENFQEFDQPIGPQRTTSDIISHAFEMYKGVFLYALLAMVIYILATVFIQSISGFSSMSLSEEMRSSRGDFSTIRFTDIPGIGTYYLLSGLLGIVVTLLFVGVIYLANKFNLNEPLQFPD